MPWITDPCFSGSSSTKPRTSSPRSPRVMISLAASTPARACTDQQHVPREAVASGGAAPAVALETLEQRTADHAQPDHAAEREHRVDQRDRQRHPPLLECLRKCESQDDHRQQRPPRRLDEHGQLGEADVAPHERVDPRQQEGRELDQDDVGELAQALHEDALGEHEVEPEPVGNGEGQDQDENVEGVLHLPAEETRPHRLTHRHPGARSGRGRLRRGRLSHDDLEWFSLDGTKPRLGERFLLLGSTSFAASRSSAERTAR